MATLLSCDHCGEIINPDDTRSTLAAFVSGSPTRHDGWRRDYHAGCDRDCIGAVLAAVEAANSFRSLPVTNEGGS